MSVAQMYLRSRAILAGAITFSDEERRIRAERRLQETLTKMKAQIDSAVRGALNPCRAQRSVERAYAEEIAECFVEIIDNADLSPP